MQMSQLVTAIYENGVLRPLTPLTLPEHTEVQIYVQSTLNAVAHRQQVAEALVMAGLTLPTQEIAPTSKLLSTQQRQELAQRFGSAGRPLSELIIEERKGR
jgi:predicted DNA-binding antitoxin AbrB/MazE fold protein